MDKSVVNELAATVAALRAAGETGFWVLVVVLLVFIGIGIAALIYQRIIINKFQTAAKTTEELISGLNTNIKVIEANIKSVETSMKERELGIKERDEFRNVLTQQFSTVKVANDDMRAELNRLRDQQKGLKDSINNTITEGLQDIRDRLSQTSIKEIIAQVPDSFREELAVEFEATLRRSAERLAEQLNDFNKLENLLERLWKEAGARLNSDEFAQRIAAHVQAKLQTIGSSLPVNPFGRLF
jgi:hypothetical protein